MKKILSIIILICTLFCYSCDFNKSSSNESSSSSYDEENSSGSEISPEESETESEINSEIQKESESSKQESSSENEEQSSFESQPESSTQKESESTSEIESETEETIPVVTQYGSFSSALTETKKADDRLKQMASSALTYNKGATCSEKELKSTLSSANSIKSGGNFLNYKNASKLMEHFLGNSGEDYIIDMNEFLKDSNAMQTRNDELNKALRACEVLAREGESINVFQKEEIVHHNLTGDWKFAVGSYFTTIAVKDLTVSEDTYSATFVYGAIDFYNWDFNNDTPVFSGLAAMIVGDVSPKDLHQLHRAGLAQEFLSHGEITYTVTWTKGATATSISGFNK